ncbi:MAG TPA: M23 family metallopeptidase [Blastocatellia bacterium]|nr:M23 family metallopeptidase [Blastocatellia bacterium]
MKSLFYSTTLLLISVPAALAYPRLMPMSPETETISLLVKTEPLALVNGSPCLFMVRSSQSLKALSGLWQKHRVFFNFNGTDNTWYGLAAIGIETVSGRYPLTLTATLASGELNTSNHSIQIQKTAYRTANLGVSEIFTQPDAETLERIGQERELKNRVFSMVTEARLWNGRFVSPVHNQVTEEFGVRRTFNAGRSRGHRRRGRQSRARRHKVVLQRSPRQTRIRQSRVRRLKPKGRQTTRIDQPPRFHQGLDYRAATGTPVAAMNSGRVVLARDLFYEGGFVVIDHGQGLLTLYLHLSQIQATEGQMVKKGETVGLSGATGRVTGPHLHVGVRWQGVYLNPETLLTLDLR